MAKRTFDMVVALTGLIMAVPVIVAIAIAIKCDSRGPVLFRQERVGLAGRTFRIHKFRTMFHDAAVRGPDLTIGDDARVTRIGRFLRRSKLDELPQLYDVLIGEMSLVGPRPELPRYVALYPEEVRERILAVRPGITDPASLYYADESQLLGNAKDPEREYVEVILPLKIRAAVRYAEQATLRTDLGIIARTLHLLLRRAIQRAPFA